MSNPLKERLLAALRWNTHVIASYGTDGLMFEVERMTWSTAIDALRRTEYELGVLSFPDRWRRMADEQPKPGQLIVKFWRATNTTWSGPYTGNPKDSSFDLWYPLPEPR